MYNENCMVANNEREVEDKLKEKQHNMIQRCIRTEEKNRKEMR